MTSSIANSTELLRSGVELLMHATQILAIDVRVDLRGRNVDVAEHFLNGSQIGTTLEQMGRERVTKRVRRDRFGYSNLINVLPENLPRPHSRHRLAAGIEKKYTLSLAALELGPQLP